MRHGVARDTMSHDVRMASVCVDEMSMAVPGRRNGPRSVATERGFGQVPRNLAIDAQPRHGIDEPVPTRRPFATTATTLDAMP
jgi:hypothetical protein